MAQTTMAPMTTPQSPDFVQLRRAMVDNQLRTFSVIDHAVLERMQLVPRELFLPEALRVVAYADGPVRVGARQMLAPMVLARLIQTAKIKASDRILDVGGAAGYSAAVLSGLGVEVVALEADEVLTRAATVNFAAAGIANVRAVTGALDAGFAAAAPFNVIFLNGRIDVEPTSLLSQLAEGGRLVALRPAASAGRAGRAVVYEKSGDNVGLREIFDAVAPPLPGFTAAPAFAF